MQATQSTSSCWISQCPPITHKYSNFVRLQISQVGDHQVTQSGRLNLQDVGRCECDSVVHVGLQLERLKLDLD